MEIGFWYKDEKGKINVYFKGEEWDSLAGLHYTEGMEQAEVDRRGSLALAQCMLKLTSLGVKVNDCGDVRIVANDEDIPEETKRVLLLEDERGEAIKHIENAYMLYR